ncbi:MAG: helix-turn-helix domain-containing protein [Deltaproteobacteria bacterium]|nr:helix-turn-helix domain-containing protein [Deltaproteobacteria bacterium]
MLNMYLFELGTKLREARLGGARTQSALATVAGLGRTTVNQLEAGVVPDLGVKKVIRLLRAVGLDLAVVPAARKPTPDFLRMACVSANVSFKNELTPEDLAQALLTGKAPRGFRPHIRAVFEEVPREVLLGALSQLAGPSRDRERILEGARRLAKGVGCYLEVSS